MRVLLTGGSGFIGGQVLSLLLSMDISVVTVGRRALSSRARHFNLDLLDTPNLYPLIRDVQPTHLLHFAWFGEHGQYWESPVNLRWVEATTRLVEAVCSGRIKYVLAAGSCAEYDWQSGYCDEIETPLRPTTCYGATKDATRRLVTDICTKNGVPLAWVRPFLSYGVGEPSGKLVPSLIKVLQGRSPPFKIFSSASRDFLHVTDIARAIMQIFLNEASGSYNVSSGEATRLQDVIAILSDILRANPEPIFAMAEERENEPRLIVGVNSKLRRLGWMPSLTLYEGLERTVYASD